MYACKRERKEKRKIACIREKKKKRGEKIRGKTRKRCIFWAFSKFGTSFGPFQTLGAPFGQLPNSFTPLYGLLQLNNRASLIMTIKKLQYRSKNKIRPKHVPGSRIG